MISLSLNINPEEILSNKTKYDQDVSDSLHEIAELVPKHTSKIFKRRLWAYFKLEIWKQQGLKCAFCEKEIISADDCHVEHFRPKTRVQDDQNKIVTRESYWWLAYDHRNYLGSCFTCNTQKGDKFPIADNGTRVVARDIDEISELNDKGVLGNEIPLLINPRYKDPEQHFAYSLTPKKIMPLVLITSSDNYGINTIDVLDLNRIRKNEKAPKDYLPRKRGDVLNKFKNDIEIYVKDKTELNLHKSASMLSANAGFQEHITSMESDINKKREVIKERYLSYSAEFSGMCLFWLENYMDLRNDFPGTDR